MNPAPRLYLDWNASAPLRPAARAAMAAAMEVVGNPSSQHGEGRAAKAIIEKARGQILTAAGAEGADLVFTAGATEAAALALYGRGLQAAPIEHDAVRAHCTLTLAVSPDGAVQVPAPAVSTLQLANSETGILQDLPPGLAVSDLTQAFGKIPMAFNWLGAEMGLLSAHKAGGPKGIGALLLRPGATPVSLLRGGGQEMGRRAGTENVIGIAGFGAAAEAAAADLAAGLWEEVAALRDLLQAALLAAAPEVQVIGARAPRLPNTLCLYTPGRRGETQVMQMDLAGFAISAGSACSSGKLRQSPGLAALGYEAAAAGEAIRLSLGPGLTREDVLRFAESWAAAGRKTKIQTPEKA